MKNIITYKERILNFTLLFLLVSVIIIACGKDESPAPDDDKANVEDPNDTNDDKDDENNSGAYQLTGHLIETELPCYVNIMFQVSNMEGKGVSSLKTEDFEVTEDGQAVSPTESAMQIKKKDALAYNIKTVLMLDNSKSVGNNIEQIKSAAIKLIDNIAEHQELALYVFSDNAVLLQDFTSDVELLKEAVGKIELGYSTTNLYGSLSKGVSRWNDS